MENTFAARLAVCSWSLQPGNPAQLLAQLQTIGLRRVQIALGPFRESPQVWDEFPRLGAAQGIELVSGMIATVGEDYSTPETIRRTGGVVPDATWAENWRNIQAEAVVAQRLGLKLVTFHAGFLPHDPAEPDFAKLLDRIARIADLFAVQGIDLGLETGQETAQTLKIFLNQLNRPNVGVNYDPANIILYDQGDPIEALRQLGPWLRQCHVKDAIRTRIPGTWGREVAAGEGEVDWPAFFEVLQALEFQGDLAIEREAGHQRVADIITARQYIGRLP